MTDRLLPPNATKYEVALEQTTGEHIEALPVPLREVWSPDDCPPALLPWLAWSFGVERWNSSWNTDERRRAIKSSIDIKKRKGTPYAVRVAISALFSGASFQEWYQQTTNAARYTFRLQLEVTDQPLEQYLLNSVVRIVESTKNLRSHVSEIAVSARTECTPQVAGVCGFGVELTIGPNTAARGVLRLDGSWLLDGVERLDGVSNG